MSDRVSSGSRKRQSSVPVRGARQAKDQRIVSTTTVQKTDPPETSAASAIEVLLLPDPVKSFSDKKSYRNIQLPNGLKVLLISDPEPIYEPENRGPMSALRPDSDDSESSDEQSDNSGDVAPPAEVRTDSEASDPESSEESATSGDKIAPPAVLRPDSDGSDGSAASEEEEDDDDESDSDYDAKKDKQTEIDDEDDDEDESDDDEDEEDDIKEKLAACSLVVDVGSFSDPRDVQGLAHFVEHMIFMGSDKYPKENELDEYLQKCGGSNNAYTNCEETQFLFETDEQFLDGTMDRFASLFKAPLMQRDAMERERKSVESEFKTKQTDDAVRREQLLVSLAKYDSLAATFSWGNMVSLRDAVVGGDDAMHERLRRFYLEHYSARRMFLCVQARWPLDRLQELVVRHWADMPNHPETVDEVREPPAAGDQAHLDVFLPEFHTHILLVRPIADNPHMDLTFCLPSCLHRYRTRPEHFVGHLLGYEGPGSLCSVLRKRLWCLELVAGIEAPGFETNSLYTFFSITLKLTPLGCEHLRDIYTMVFAYLHFLRAAGSLEAQFRDVQRIDDIGFRFAEERTSYDLVEDLAENLKYYPPELLISADYQYLEYDEAQIDDVVRRLCDPDTPLNVMVTSGQVPPEFGDVADSFDQREHWFQTEYAHFEMPDEWLALRRDPGAAAVDAFKLPAPNPFIATDFEIVYRAGQPPVPELPVCLLRNDELELWHRLDDKFLLPNATFNLYLQSPACRGTAEACVLNSLLSLLLKKVVEERLYAATVGGLTYLSIEADSGVLLYAGGYNQHLDRLVDELARALHSIADQLTEQEFRAIADGRLQDYYNIMVRPKWRINSLRLQVLENGMVSTPERFERTKTVTLDDFRRFMCAMLGSLRVTALVQGNITATAAQTVVQRFVRTIGCRPLPMANVDLVTVCCNRLPAGRTYVRVPNGNPNDGNSITSLYFQMGVTSIRLGCMIDLLVSAIEEVMFDQLRTQQQLGYDIGCSVRDSFGVMGFMVQLLSQEADNSAELCDERIADFLERTFVEHLDTLNDELYVDIREAVIKAKQTADEKLTVEAQRNWSEISSRDYVFDRRRREIECLRSVSLAEFIDFYKTHVVGENPVPSLCVQIVGNVAAGKDTRVPERGDAVLTKRFEKPAAVEWTADRAAEKSGTLLVRDLDEFCSSLVSFGVLRTNLTDA